MSAEFELILERLLAGEEVKGYKLERGGIYCEKEQRLVYCKVHHELLIGDCRLKCSSSEGNIFVLGHDDNVKDRLRIRRQNNVLYIELAGTKYLVADLVAKAFYGEPSYEKSYVTFVDGDPTNVDAYNLKWIDATNDGSTPIRQYNMSGVLVGTFDNVEVASEETGVDIRQIRISMNKPIYHIPNTRYVWRRCDDDELYSLSVKERRNSCDEFDIYWDIVRQYTLDGEFVAEYSTSIHAANVLACDRRSIAQSCHRKTMQTVGYLWRFACNDEFDNGHIVSKIDSMPAKRVRQFTIDGKFIAEYQSASYAAKKTGIKMVRIGEACWSSDQPEVGGFVWRFADDEAGTLEVCPELKWGIRVYSCKTGTLVAEFSSGLESINLTGSSKIFEAARAHKTDSMYSFHVYVGNNLECMIPEGRAAVLKRGQSENKIN